MIDLAGEYGRYGYRRITALSSPASTACLRTIGLHVVAAEAIIV